MKIYIGSDHGGFRLKGAITQVLDDLQLSFEDMGTHSTRSTDYGPIGKNVAEKVALSEDAKGILICGTGIGMSIIANKVPGIRAAVVHDVFSAEATRAHNDSNILCLGERVIGQGLAEMIVQTWLQTVFKAGKHERRIDFIKRYEA
ncbi:ribose 5-phosphate isomerase B [Salipaludibacillus agaradhaerens]|uniref:ribose 5-phosphate isomerase B n=1 Tax=Salipaludibacillus agaradhaerens TaxID=76935 RepID=UPI0009970129|nr:ribose 5-phosphate isomerase B [Salipaludibacillus agaradhaerens]